MHSEFYQYPIIENRPILDDDGNPVLDSDGNETTEEITHWILGEKFEEGSAEYNAEKQRLIDFYDL